MKIVLLVALAFLWWLKGPAFLGKIWLAFVSPRLSKVDDIAARAVVSDFVSNGKGQRLSPEQVGQVRSAGREERS